MEDGGTGEREGRGGEEEERERREREEEEREWEVEKEEYDIAVESLSKTSRWLCLRRYAIKAVKALLRQY